jgi:replication-associated recombination protein RarA
MILTILKGKAGTGKTRLADIIRAAEGIETFVFNGSLALAKKIVKTNYQHIILDECEDKKIINYLKNKATSIFLITCERIK